MAKQQTKRPVAQALQTAPAPVKATVTVITPDANLAKFEEYGKLDGQAQNAWAMRVPFYAQALKGVAFPIWESYRKAYCHGAIEGGYAESAVDVLWNQRVAEPLKLMGVVKPKSPDSSAQRPKSAEAQAKLDRAKAEADSIGKMSKSQIETELKDKSLTAERRSALYVGLSKIVKGEASAKAKKEREASQTARKACVEQLDLMSSIGLQHALTILAEIAKKYPKA